MMFCLPNNTINVVVVWLKSFTDYKPKFADSCGKFYRLLSVDCLFSDLGDGALGVDTHTA